MVRKEAKCLFGQYEKIISLSGLNYIDYKHSFQLFWKQNYVMMSIYKTPIRIQLDTSRKVNQMTQKYKLPFSKEVSHLQRVFSVNKLQNYDVIPEDSTNNEPDYNKSRIKRNKHEEKSQAEQKYQLLPYSTEHQNPSYNIRNIREIIKTPIRQLQQIQTPQKTVQKVATTKPSNFKIEKSLELKIRSKSKNSSDLNSSKKMHKQSSIHRREQYSSSANRYTEEDAKNAGKQSENAKDEKQPVQTYEKRQSFQRKYINKVENASNSLRRFDICPCEYLVKSTENKYQQNISTKERVLRTLLKRSKQKLNQSMISNSSATTERLEDLAKPRYQQQDGIYDHLPSVRQSSQSSSLPKQLQKKLLKKLQLIVSVLQSEVKGKPAFTEAYKQQYDLIKSYNPFFKKINQLGCHMMLNCGKLKFLKPNDLLFNEGQPISHLSLIILGRVLLSKSQRPKDHGQIFVQMGETLGEEALFDQSKPYHLRFTKNSPPVFYKLQAKAQTQLCILRINLKKFYKMCIELNMIGEKRLFTLIDTMFKVNYIKKKAILHQKFKERLKTEILGSLRKKVSSFYFE